jgi:hypothetical protein
VRENITAKSTKKKGLTTKWVMRFRSPANMKIKIFVMPAWIAGIQLRKDASGDIHVNRHSSIPCWNDPIEGFSWN